MAAMARCGYPPAVVTRGLPDRWIEPYAIALLVMLGGGGCRGGPGAFGTPPSFSLMGLHQRVEAVDLAHGGPVRVTINLKDPWPRAVENAALKITLSREPCRALLPDITATLNGAAFDL